MVASIPPDSYPIGHFIPWKMHGAPHQYPIALENAAKHILWGDSGTLVPILLSKYPWFSPWLSSTRFPFCDILFIAWEMYYFFNQFLIVRENVAKPIPREKTGIQIPILFPKVWLFLSMKFRSYGALRHMRHAWIFP